MARSPPIRRARPRSREQERAGRAQAPCARGDGPAFSAADAVTDRTRNLEAALGSSRICVQRFGGPRDMAHGAVWCLTGLALMAAFARVVASVSEGGALVLAVPLLLVALGLVVVGSLCAIGAPLLWLSALLARFRPG